ncbi:MAG: radical SAM protein, partial [Oligoflexia bacterium]|nr:radical SAM protein [Oligoflexia bacterium]
LRRRLHHLVLHLGQAGAGGLSAGCYRRLADELGPLLWLDINGDEPFDRPDLPKLVSAFDTEVLTLISSVADVERVVEHTRRVREERSGDVVVALNLDGLHPTHDRLHGPGSWDRVWQAFDRLALLDDVRVELHTRLCTNNAPEALALAEYVWQQGPDAHVVSLPKQLAEDAAPIDLLDQLQGPLFQILDRYTPDDGRLLTRLRRNYHRLRWAVTVQTLVEGRQIIPCLAGLSYAVVHRNGDVASCDLLPSLGNLSSTHWSDIWSGGALQAQREYIGAGGCHCTDDCAMHDSIVLRAQNLPRLLGA